MYKLSDTSEMVFNVTRVYMPHTLSRTKCSDRSAFECRLSQLQRSRVGHQHMPTSYK